MGYHIRRVTGNSRALGNIDTHTHAAIVHDTRGKSDVLRPDLKRSRASAGARRVTIRTIVRRLCGARTKQKRMMPSSTHHPHLLRFATSRMSTGRWRVWVDCVPVLGVHRTTLSRGAREDDIRIQIVHVSRSDSLIAIGQGVSGRRLSIRTDSRR